MKLGAAIERAAASEHELVSLLYEIGERHKADHDVFHVTKTLARMEADNLAALAPHAERYGTSIDGGEAPGEPGPVHKAVEKGAELVGRRPEPSLLLLRDLRAVYLGASGVSIDWVMLAQGAQAAQDTDLLAAVTECHEQTLRTVKWATTRIKTAAPQALVA